MLEVLRHDGPARLGKFQYGGETLTTPGLMSLKDYGSLFLPQEMDGPGILPDFPSGLDVPREVAEFAVEETLNAAKEYPDYPAVVQGAKYPDLRLRCARNLGDRPLLVIADGAKLLKRPRLLAEILPGVREVVGPNTALCLPHAPAMWFPLLAYMGVDIFDELSARVKARGGIMDTDTGTWKVHELRELPCACRACAGKGPEDLGYEGLLGHNLGTARKNCTEIREAIRAGTLRNLVEVRASGQVDMMVTLRLLDENRSDFLEEYTPVRP